MPSQFQQWPAFLKAKLTFYYLHYLHSLSAVALFSSGKRNLFRANYLTSRAVILSNLFLVLEIYHKNVKKINDLPIWDAHQSKAVIYVVEICLHFNFTPSYWQRSSKKVIVICFLSGSIMGNQGAKKITDKNLETVRTLLPYISTTFLIVD